MNNQRWHQDINRIVRGPGEVVAIIPCPSDAGPRPQDARLICAAPVLLAALEQAEQWITTHLNIGADECRASRATWQQESATLQQVRDAIRLAQKG